MDREERGIEINLMQIIKVLLEKARYILLIAIVFGIIGYVVSAMFLTPVYQASARMIVNSRKDETLNITNDQLNSARNLVETYAVIICGRDVLNQVIDELNLAEDYEELVEMISVKSVNDTPVMQITVKHTDRNVALHITGKILEIAPDILVETAEAGSVKPVEQAYADIDPVSPNVVNNTILMMFVGFVMACLLFFALMLMDNTYKTDADIQKDLGIPVLGVIPEVERCKAYPDRKKIKKVEVAK